MIKLFHRFLLGLFVSSVTNGLYWLITGEAIPAAANVALGLTLCLAFEFALVSRSLREQEHLRTLYNLPARGE